MTNSVRFQTRLLPNIARSFSAVQPFAVSGSSARTKTLNPNDFFADLKRRGVVPAGIVFTRFVNWQERAAGLRAANIR